MIISEELRKGLVEYFNHELEHDTTNVQINEFLDALDKPEEDIPTEIDITAQKDFEFSESTMDNLAEDVNEYLANKYGYLNGGWSFSVVVGDILWEFDNE